MKKEEIIEVLAELHKITGFRVSLHGADYSEIAAYPKEKNEFCRMVHEIKSEYDECVNCDKSACKLALENKSTNIYYCRYGMTEAVSPLYNFGILTGFLMMGQIFECDEFGKAISKREKRIAALGDEFVKSSEKIPHVNSEMTKSYVKIMTICAQYLTLSNAIPSSKRSIAEMAKKFIFDNYRTKITISDICNEIGCSKSTLLTAFKKQYGTTVNDYLTEVRLSEAANMLALGESNIGEIALYTGFSDQSYFSKVFSARFKMTPSEYQRKEQNQ